MHSNIQIERRTYPRYRVKMYTEIITPAFYLVVNTIEISVEGIRVETFSSIKPGTEVTVSFDYKNGLLFFGKVMWEIAFPKNDIIKFDIGIKIHRITFSGIKLDGFNSKDELIKDILDELDNPV